MGYIDLNNLKKIKTLKVNNLNKEIAAISCLVKNLSKKYLFYLKFKLF